MKKMTLYAALLALSLGLTACGSTPSDAEIKKALNDGTITVEDAKSKGWIDDKWIEENFEQVEAQSKIYLFEPFETTYLDGTPASSSIINGTMCLVFFDTTADDTMTKLLEFENAYTEMEDAGVPLLGIATNDDPETASAALEGKISFPVIVYNEEMKKSMEKYSGMVEKDLAGVFTRDGGFYTAWYTDADADSLIDAAKGLAATD